MSEPLVKISTSKQIDEMREQATSFGAGKPAWIVCSMADGEVTCLCSLVEAQAKVNADLSAEVKRLEAKNKALEGKIGQQP